MENIELVDRIKSGPHWRVNIRPANFEKYRVSSLSELHKLIEGCQVALRGWYFPHIDRNGIINGDDWIMSEGNYGDIIEYWRFYQSAQFIHYFNIYENCDEDVKKKAKSIRLDDNRVEPSGYVSIISTLYRITEIYEFAMRLAQKSIFQSGLSIKISIKGVKNFQLFFWDRLRVLHDAYISGIDEINFESVMTIDDLLANGHDEALNKAISVFERFNWNNPPQNILAEDQKKLLERRL